MNSENETTIQWLDKIKTTITISMGMKNRLRKYKGGASYEQYIGYLLRKVDPKELRLE